MHYLKCSLCYYDIEVNRIHTTFIQILDKWTPQFSPKHQNLSPTQIFLQELIPYATPKSPTPSK